MKTSTGLEVDLSDSLPGNQMNSLGLLLTAMWTDVVKNILHQEVEMRQMQAY